MSNPYHIQLEELRLVGVRIIAPAEVIRLIAHEAKQQTATHMEYDPASSRAILTTEEWRSLIGGIHRLRHDAQDRYGRDAQHILISIGGLVAVDVGNSEHVGLFRRFAEYAAST